MSWSRSAEPRAGADPDSPGPSVRPLGYLAAGCGVLSLLLALTLFLSVFALPLGVLALGLGLAARTEESTQKLGTVGVVLGLLSLACATTFLVLLMAS